MLNKAPRHLPSLALMLDDLGQPSTKALATFLDVDQRTVQRWVRHDTMPRTALMSLFWLTRWGRSAVDADAVNDATQQASLAACYRQELHALRQEFARVLALCDFGSANSPTYRYGLSATSIEPAPPKHVSRQSLRLVSRATPRGR